MQGAGSLPEQIGRTLVEVVPAARQPRRVDRDLRLLAERGRQAHDGFPKALLFRRLRFGRRGGEQRVCVVATLALIVVVVADLRSGRIEGAWLRGSPGFGRVDGLRLVLGWGHRHRWVLRFEGHGRVLGLCAAHGRGEVGLAAWDGGVGRGVLGCPTCGSAYLGVSPAFVEGGLLRAVFVGGGGGGLVSSVPV